MTRSSVPAVEPLERRCFCSVAPTDGGVVGNGVDINAVSGTVFRGEVAEFVPPYDMARPRGWRAWVDWGDGSRRTRGRVVATGAEGAAGMSVLGRHRYAEAGEYALTVDIDRRRPRQPGSGITWAASAHVLAPGAFAGATFERTGGIEGSHRTISITPDGRLTATGPRRASPPLERALSSRDVADLVAAFNGWDDLLEVYGPSRVFDGYDYHVTYLEKEVTVLAMPDEVPPTFTAVAALMQRLAGDEPWLPEPIAWGIGGDGSR